MAKKAELEALLRAAVASAPAATPATAGWLAQAAAAVAPPQPANGADKPPVPLLAEVEERSGNRQSDGKPYAFKVLNVHNGKNGKFHRGTSLDARYLSRVVDWLGTPAGQAFIKTRAF